LIICALIPSYDEAKTIGLLVQKVKAKGLDVIVVDDGSTDRTGQNAAESGAVVLRNEQNEGKGAALKRGFEYAIEHDYDAVITMDADEQHSVSDIENFLSAAADPEISMVAGNRMISTKEMPIIRRMTNTFMSSLISLICRNNVPDSQCGFRLIKKKLLKKLNLTCSNYEIESETVIQAYHKGFKVKFIPIQTIYAKQTSQINPIIDTIRFFKFIFKILFARIADQPDKNKK